MAAMVLRPISNLPFKKPSEPPSPSTSQLTCHAHAAHQLMSLIRLARNAGRLSAAIDALELDASQRSTLSLRALACAILSATCLPCASSTSVRSSTTCAGEAPVDCGSHSCTESDFGPAAVHAALTATGRGRPTSVVGACAESSKADTLRRSSAFCCCCCSCLFWACWLC